MNRRPCWSRSSRGPMSGASTANGAMVTSRAIATWLRAWLTEALKNKVPASATATKASPTLLAAVSSIRLASPVRLAPEAPVIRWTTRPAPRLAEAPTLALDWAADVSLRVARLALSRPSAHPMVPVFCAFAPATNRQAGRAPAERRSAGQGHAAEGGGHGPRQPAAGVVWQGRDRIVVRACT